MLLNYATSATQAASAAPTPIRNVEILPNGDIKVTYTFSSALLTTTSVLGKTCYVWSISGFGQNTSSTEAALPRRIDSFQIPEGKTATVSLLSSSYKSFCYNMAAGSSPRNEGSTMTERARPVPSSSVPLPANVVSMASIQSYRGVNIANVMVCPAQYISSSTTIRAYTTISYLVHFSESASTVSKKNDKERDLMYFTMDYLIHNGTTEDIKVAPSSGGGGGGVSGNGEFNPGDPIHTTTNLSTGPVDADLTYVILTTDALKSSTVNFAKWKKMQGYNVVTLSAPSWTHDSAKSAVRALYNQYPDFYHLLIVGGANDVPGYNPVGTVGALIIDRYPSDYPFSLKEDNDDALPDITVGRIPLSNSEEITDALYKIRRYEKAMHIFGDPSMLVHTEAVANASSVATVTRSDNKKQTNGDFTSLPMISVRSDKNVFIGMYNNATGETKRYYGSFLNYYPSTTDKWDVTVYEANLRPLISYYEGITIVFPSLNGVSYDSSNNICTTSVDTEECDDENYEIEVRDSFGTVVGRTEGSGSGIQKIPVTSNKDGVHIVSLLYDGAIVESKHFLK